MCKSVSSSNPSVSVSGLVGVVPAGSSLISGFTAVVSAIFVVAQRPGCVLYEQ